MMVSDLKQLWLWYCLCFSMGVYTLPTLDFSYHKYNNLTKYLKDVAMEYPNITRLYSIGASLRRRELWVLEISTAPKTELGVPNVKLIGNIHGNEPAGREVLLHLIQFLVSNYTTDDSVRWLLNNTRIHILPSLNPDGFENSLEGCCDSVLGRGNAKLTDLNRSFPDYFQENPVSEQEETKAVINWMNNTTFVLSASLHGGALVANYPFESVKETTASEMMRNSRASSISPDDDVFRHLATVYASTHPTMHQGLKCKNNETGFVGGITNGANWYPVTGGMQDYNYVYHGCMEITLEISCCKYPQSWELPGLWNDNKEALIRYITQVHQGVKGLVVDKNTGEPIVNVNLNITGREINFRTSSRGEFWRILLPGTYELKVSAPNYILKKITFTVPKIKEKHQLKPIWLNISLSTEEDIQSTMSTIYDNTIDPTDEYSTSVSEPTSSSTSTITLLNSILVESNYEQMRFTSGGQMLSIKMAIVSSVFILHLYPCVCIE